jgi:hypothetical protein
MNGGAARPARRRTPLPLLTGALLLAAGGCGRPADAAGAADAAVRAALHEVGVQQIRFRDRHGRFGRSAQELGVVPPPGVRVEIPRVDADGYLAVATHPQGRHRCTLRVGGRAAHADAPAPGLACG